MYVETSKGADLYLFLNFPIRFKIKTHNGDTFYRLAVLPPDGR